MTVHAIAMPSVMARKSPETHTVHEATPTLPGTRTLYSFHLRSFRPALSDSTPATNATQSAQPASEPRINGPDPMPHRRCQHAGAENDERDRPTQQVEMDRSKRTALLPPVVHDQPATPEPAAL